METKKSLKTLRVAAEEMSGAGITNQEKLFAALPVLTELQTAVETQRKTLYATTKVAAELSELCTAYAVKHPSVFRNGKLVENQQRVLTGDVPTEDATYHLACGYDGYKRTEDKAKITQDFLAGLPKSWRKSKFELDTTGINEANPTKEELAEYGLCEKPKNVWSHLAEC